LVSATQFEGWTADVRAEFTGHAAPGPVGSRLLSEDRRVRVWSIHLQPGERLGAHQHALDYFWTALASGGSLQHVADGSTRLVTYAAGDTCHFEFGPGETLLHDLENIGDAALAFVTVEFLPPGAHPFDPTHPVTTGGPP
jgi:hypothetical protein